MKNNDWTEKDLDFIRTNYKKMSDADMGIALKRKRSAVGYARRKMGLKHHDNKKIDEETMQKLKEFILDHPEAERKEIIQKFEVTPWIVHKAKSELGFFDDVKEEKRKELTDGQRKKLRRAVIMRLNACKNKVGYICKCTQCLEAIKINKIYDESVDEKKYYEEIKHLLEG